MKHCRRMFTIKSSRLGAESRGATAIRLSGFRALKRRKIAPPCRKTALTKRARARHVGLVPRQSLFCLGLLFVVSIAGAPAAAQTTAIVTRNVNLRTGPSSSRAIIRQLAPPDELSILDTVRTNGYYEARTPGGDHGWVWARNVRITGTTPATPIAAGPPEVYRSCPLQGSALQAHRQESNRKKNRITRPAPSEIDSSATLAGLLQGGADQTRWSDTRGASIVAFVVEVKKGGEETVNCGETDSLYRDTHIDVVLDPQDRRKVVRVVVEVTPRWRSFMSTQGQNWRTGALKQALEGR